MSQDQTDAQIETKVSTYDLVNAFLVSMLIVVGTMVAIMFLIWLTMIWNRREPPLRFIVDPSFGNEKPEGFADDIYEPGVEEFPEVETPQLADALEAITQAVSTVRANLEARDGDAAEMGKGRGFGSRDGGPGTGNFRGVPEHKRWKIEYQAANITEYAKQLSFFNIDIGVISNSNNEVVRLQQPGPSGNLLNSNRETENNNKSLYFIHEKLRLRRWDESLVRQKGVDLTSKFTVQFYPEATRVVLRQVEGQYLHDQQRQLVDVRRTRFKVVPDGSSYAFEIVEVEYQ
jgi:hypothetical protein